MNVLSNNNSNNSNNISKPLIKQPSQPTNFTQQTSPNKPHPRVNQCYQKYGQPTLRCTTHSMHYKLEPSCFQCNPCSWLWSFSDFAPIFFCCVYGRLNRHSLLCCSACFHGAASTSASCRPAKQSHAEDTCYLRRASMLTDLGWMIHAVSDPDVMFLQGFLHWVSLASALGLFKEY